MNIEDEFKKIMKQNAEMEEKLEENIPQLGEIEMLVKTLGDSCVKDVIRVMSVIADAKPEIKINDPNLILCTIMSAVAWLVAQGKLTLTDEKGE